MGEGGGRAGKTPRGGLSSPPLGRCAGIGLRLVRLARRVPRSGRPGGEKAMTRCLQAWPPTAWASSQAANPHDSPLSPAPRIAGAEPVGQQATAPGLVGTASRRSIQRVIAHYIFANPIITGSSITGGLDPKSAGQAELRGARPSPTQVRPRHIWGRLSDPRASCREVSACN